MNKITKFVSEISQQTLKIYLKNTIITKTWQRAKIILYVHQQPMVADHGTQYEENPSSHHGGIHEG